MGIDVYFGYLCDAHQV